MTGLWSEASPARWRATLDAYAAVIRAQGVAALPALDDWYCDELPALITSRAIPHLTSAELVRVTEWKMHRGVWRAPNLVRVKGNAPDLVIDVTSHALALIPHATAPVKAIATLDGVGPATASAITAAVTPDRYPFFDEIVAAQVPSLGAVAWTLGYYAKYAEALRQRAAALGDGWTPVMIERALWSDAGGKVQRRAGVS